MNNDAFPRSMLLIPAVFLLFVATACSAAEAERPNIVLIMADDFGCETLGCYGGTSYKTPHLDKLAAEGMRFRYGFSLPVCHPTRVCLLTGRYPFRLGNPRWGSFPGKDEKLTVAHVMKKAGYATAIAGKWQLTMMRDEPDHPQRLGFDKYSLFGWHEGPRYYQPMIYQNGRVRDDVKDRYGPDVYVEFLTDFIEKNKEKLFFAFYSMALCHDVTDDLREPVPFGPKGRYDTYKEMVEATDVRVGRLVAALDRMKLREKTLILFTGDNGTSKSYIHTAKDGKLIRKPVFSKRNGVEVRGGKGELTDFGTNVPLIANWTGTIEAGQVVNDLVDMSDYFATCADLAKAEQPKGVKIDGHSFAPRLRGQSGNGREWAFAESGKRHWARTQQWKLYNDGRLFDLKVDPNEKKPIAPGSETSRVAASARSRLQEALDLLRVGK